MERKIDIGNGKSWCDSRTQDKSSFTPSKGKTGNSVPKGSGSTKPGYSTKGSGGNASNMSKGYS